MPVGQGIAPLRHGRPSRRGLQCNECAVAVTAQKRTVGKRISVSHVPFRPYGLRTKVLQKAETRSVEAQAHNTKRCCCCTIRTCRHAGGHNISNNEIPCRWLVSVSRVRIRVWSHLCQTSRRFRRPAWCVVGLSSLPFNTLPTRAVDCIGRDLCWFRRILHSSNMLRLTSNFVLIPVHEAIRVFL